MNEPLTHAEIEANLAYENSRYKVWAALHDAGFVALESEQDEIEICAETWSKAGFIHWMYQYTDGKVSKNDAATIYDLIND